MNAKSKPVGNESAPEINMSTFTTYVIPQLASVLSVKNSNPLTFKA